MPADKAAACDCGGNGFAAVYSAPVVNASQGLAPYLEQVATGIFREVGGYVQDLDGDGTEDVTLIYHWCQVTFSVITQSLINTVCYDSAQDDPTGHPCNGTHLPCREFHSGRNYGTHSSWSDEDYEYTTIVAGDTNGNFKNVM
jgi:hypothetical protein